MSAFGFFDEQTDEYVITTPVAPRPQENALFNERYFAFTHQTGNGFSKYTDPGGYATTIIAGTNEPAYNTNSRLIYIRDDKTGQFWSVGYYPVSRRFESFECRCGAGYTIVTNATDGISASWRIFVPSGNDPVELWTLTLRNTTRRKRELSVFAFAELSLETSFPTYGHASYLNSLFLKRSNGLAARKLSMNAPTPYTAGVFLSARKPTSMDANWNAFVEQFRTLANPLALETGECSGAISSRDRVAGVLHHRFSLTGGRSWRCDFAVAAADASKTESSAARYARKYLTARGSSTDRAFEGMRKSRKRLFDQVVAKTPDYKLNILFNQWIPLLIEWGVTSGRWGMLGFRDIVQQAQGFLMFSRTEKVLARLNQGLTHQYPSGKAVRSFPAVHEDSGMQYSDSSLWLIGSVTEYLKETGDMRFLRRSAAFLDGSRGTVLDHLRRTIEALWKDRGRDGLCLIHQGDWNDSLTHVGPKGRGESVWLSQAFCAASLAMEELHVYLGERRSAAKYRRYHTTVKRALNEHCWDGAWYIRAFDDKGEPIGSRSNREGKIFLNTQSWAILSKTAPPQRISKMLASIRKHLWTPYGYILLAPTYTKKQDNIGRLSCLEPGCSENGSVYTHGNAFLALALLQLGMSDEGFDVIRRIMPFNPENPSESVIPFQLANGYGGLAHRSEPGKAQYGWSTGSGAWIHQAVVEYMFGLRRTYGGLIVRPNLPSSWDDVSIKRKYRGVTYEVSYTRSEGKGNAIRELRVDGVERAPSRVLPSGPRRKYNVRVRIG